MTKLVPVTEIVTLEPTVAEFGERLLIAGTGLLTLKVRAFEAVVSKGFNTVTGKNRSEFLS